MYSHHFKNKKEKHSNTTYEYKLCCSRNAFQDVRTSTYLHIGRKLTQQTWKNPGKLLRLPF